MEKMKVAVAGATGMVGQRFVSLLENHPWFQVAAVAASRRSAGKTYHEAVDGRWALHSPVPESIGNLVVHDVNDIRHFIAEGVRLVFSAVDMTKEEIKALECQYAEKGLGVVSNNSAHRWTPDVPMIIPEINPHHAKLIHHQRRKRGWEEGFIAVKPNCSIQSYVPALAPLMNLDPKRLVVTTMQAVSGAGKTLSAWPEMEDNLIPHIGGENEKSEREPLKILGRFNGEGIDNKEGLIISAQCNRVPVSDGHMADVLVEFGRQTTREQILDLWRKFKTDAQGLGLPSAPDPFLIYRDEENRPQTRLDRDAGKGMAITIGKLREDRIFGEGHGFRFTALSHNTLRGAAGGAVETAELLKQQGYLE
jgi:aspartate-semialdehyde dehydrogenase